jgi:hypothetical protein
VRANLVEVRGTVLQNRRPTNTYVKHNMQRLQSASHIREAMALENFLNPISEVVDDKPEEMFERVIDIYGYR